MLRLSPLELLRARGRRRTSEHHERSACLHTLSAQHSCARARSIRAHARARPHAQCLRVCPRTPCT
eukprot:1672293-Alexandrium_andersonii.AAC.1